MLRLETKSVLRDTLAQDAAAAHFFVFEKAERSLGKTQIK